jgi:hypothetical protein
MFTVINPFRLHTNKHSSPHALSTKRRKTVRFTGKSKIVGMQYHLNVILPSTPGSPQWSLSPQVVITLHFVQQTCYYIDNPVVMIRRWLIPVNHKSFRTSDSLMHHVSA